MQVHIADHRLSVRQADLPMLSAKDDRMQEPRLRVRRTMVYRSVGLIVPGALCSLSWGGCISAEPAVGDAAQDRDGRGQGPALVVGERFDVG